MTTLPCPHCGGQIAAEASFCPHCGSSDADGWSDEFTDTGDEDDFDYDEYVEEHHSQSLTNTNIAPIWRFVALLLLLCILAWVYTLF